MKRQTSSLLLSFLPAWNSSGLNAVFLADDFCWDFELEINFDQTLTVTTASAIESLIIIFSRNNAFWNYICYRVYNIIQRVFKTVLQKKNLPRRPPKLRKLHQKIPLLQSRQSWIMSSLNRPVKIEYRLFKVSSQRRNRPATPKWTLTWLRMGGN